MLLQTSRNILHTIEVKDVDGVKQLLGLFLVLFS